MGDQPNEAEQNPSVPAADEAKLGGEYILLHPREHLSSPECWCAPVEVEPGLWLHNDDATHSLPFEEREPQLDGYVPDIKGHIEGDDA